MLTIADNRNESDSAAALRRLLSVTAASFEQRAHLRRALETRIVVEQAKGMLAERLRISTDEAFDILRGGARANNLRVHDLARRVLDEAETPAEVVAALHKRLVRERS
jgi:AmiR/NasT family two-component response regulator